jgi:hypothetical protein
MAPRSIDREQQERRHHHKEDTTNDDPNVALKASYLGGDDEASTA